MKKEITKNKEFYIISRNIDNAEKCNVIEIGEDYFKVKLKHLRKYEIEETVELFNEPSNGRLYFETIVKEVKNDVITLYYPITSKYIQRREYPRIISDNIIKLYNKDFSITAKIIDMSAGGLKILTEKKLELLGNYKLSMLIENKDIQTDFIPVRTEYNEERYISSGRFDNIDSLDRIILAQYCMKKQINITKGYSS